MFNKTTLPGLLSSLTKMIDSLEEHSQKANSQSIAKMGQAMELRNESEALEKESVKAYRVAQKIKELVA